MSSYHRNNKRNYLCSRRLPLRKTWLDVFSLYRQESDHDPDWIWPKRMNGKMEIDAYRVKCFKRADNRITTLLRHINKPDDDVITLCFPWTYLIVCGIKRHQLPVDIVIMFCATDQVKTSEWQKVNKILSMAPSAILRRRKRRRLGIHSARKLKQRS